MLYIGQVVNNQDPEDRGRVQVRIPGIFEDESAVDWPWSLVLHTGTGQGQGTLKVPKRGVTVVVMHEAGDLMRPIVLGEITTTQDVRATSSKTHTQGDDVHRTEGSWNVFAVMGASLSTAKRMIVEGARLVFRSSGSTSITAGGELGVEAGSERWTIKGASAKVFRGVAEWTFIRGLSLGARILKLGWIQGFEGMGTGGIQLTSLLASAQIQATAPGSCVLKTTALPLPDPTHLSSIGHLVITPTGQVFLQANPLGQVILGRTIPLIPVPQPLSLGTHAHVAVGNLGLPIVIPPSPQVTTSVFVME